jgi:hypothetical protein
VLKRKFLIDINNKRYEVYPHLETMIDKPSVENLKVIDDAFESRSIPIARRVIIQHYLDDFLKNADFLKHTNRQPTPA